jgi:hypothetical protein
LIGDAVVVDWRRGDRREAVTADRVESREAVFVAQQDLDVVLPRRRIGPDRDRHRAWMWRLLVEHRAAETEAVGAIFRERRLQVLSAADEDAMRGRSHGPRQDRRDARHVRTGISPRERDAREALAGEFVEAAFELRRRRVGDAVFGIREASGRDDGRREEAEGRDCNDEPPAMAHQRPEPNTAEPRLATEPGEMANRCIITSTQSERR